MIWNKIVIFKEFDEKKVHLNESVERVKKLVTNYCDELAIISSKKELEKFIYKSEKVLFIPMTPTQIDKEIVELLKINAIQSLLPGPTENYFDKDNIHKLGKWMNLSTSTIEAENTKVNNCGEQIELYYFKRIPGEIDRYLTHSLSEGLLDKMDRIAISAGRCTVITLRKTSQEVLLDNINIQPDISYEGDYFKMIKAVYLDDYHPIRFNKFIRDLVLYKSEGQI